MSKNPAVERAVLHFGSQAALARAIKKKQPVIWTWLYDKIRIPAEYAIEIQRATQGGVTAHQLRPDIYPHEIELPAAKKVARKTAPRKKKGGENGSEKEGREGREENSQENRKGTEAV